MIKGIIRKINKVRSEIRTDYIKFNSLPIDDGLVLLEGGQGTNINGNMFSMLRELCTNPRWSGYKTVFVVTENTLENAQRRMLFYGFDKVILCVRGSREYCRYLATAKYLLTDNSFPPFFNKRDAQVYLNTWHGTPLKTLGKSDKSNFASLANIQKNYLMSDYALFPNEFTKNVFMDDYDLRHIFRGEYFIANYPRNYVFYDSHQADEMKKRLGYGDKKLYAYMPTWRGNGRTADTQLQLDTTLAILTELDEKLSDDTVLLVNLHFMLAKDIDCSSFKHIEYFSSDFDTYEILNACDGLITDYSSAFFDFAVTGRKIILFAYDKQEYLSSRGVYIPFDSLPFPIVDTVDGVLQEMQKSVKPYDEFINAYCSDGYSNSCEKIFELMVNGKSDTFELVKQNTEKSTCLVFAGALNEKQFDDIRGYTAQDDSLNYVIAYRKNLSRQKKDFLLSLDENVTSLGTVTAYQPTLGELPAILFRRFSGKLFSRFAERERNRIFYSLKPEKVVNFSSGNRIFSAILKRFNAEYVQLGAKSSMKNIAPLYVNYQNKIKSKYSLVCISTFSFKSHIDTRLDNTYITVAEKTYKPHFICNRKKMSKKHSGIYWFSVPLNDVLDMPSANEVHLCYRDADNNEISCPIVYTSMTMGKFLGLRGPMLFDRKTNTVAIFRQYLDKNLNVYVRSRIMSDSLSKQLLQIIAFCCSLLWRGKKADKLTLLYEKNSSKYEESASALFEKLIDEGYDNSYFIVTKEHLSEIPEKYRDNVLIKHSFRHYLYFFKAKTFIGTEALVHAIDLKTFNKLALMKVADKNKNYVFLQHGVMYMVSLDSEARKVFEPLALNGKYRVVVSSQAEADHFVNLGRYSPDDLYITGLPKFDKSTLNYDADKIVIMPTWRPWEINTARDDFLETSYFRMIMRIYDSVPANLKDKVIILPHPLVNNELKNLPESVSGSIVTDAKYDNILKQARLLITDYSSIAYDAFYRGTRVIFYWEEKDECMQHYGPSTKLMLNDDNAFGDVFYSVKGLAEAIRFNYDNPQSDEYKRRYSGIVEYHDGCNTKRLIDLLRKDNII